jgi:phosphate transport system protein
MEQHIVKGFDRDLDKIKDHINKIAGLVESQLAYVYQSLNERDVLIAEKVIERDKKIDKLYQELLDISIQLFALRQPLAIDLRYVISSIKIASDLEKIGDQSKNIAKASRWLSKLPVNQKVLSVDSLFDLVNSNFRKVVNSFNEENLKEVKEIWLNDAEVNKHYDILFRETLTYMLEDTKNIPSCTQVISVAKNLERIGDQIQNIAEMIYYYVTGNHITQKISPKEMKLYKKEKKYKTDISNIFKKAKLIVKK